MPRTLSIHLRVACVLGVALAGPLYVRRFSQVPFWTPEFADEHARLTATEGGPLELLYVYRGVACMGVAARALAGAGDVDGDGYGDLVTLAPEPERGRGGSFSMRSGADGSILGRWLLPDIQRAPYSVEALGDLDRDGVTDVLLGQGSDGASWSGLQYRICSGRTGRTLVDATLTMPLIASIVRTAPTGADRGDGVRDLVVIGGGVPGLFDSARAAASLCLFEPEVVDADATAVLDVDRDGRPEIALVRRSTVDGVEALVVEVVSTAGGSPNVLVRILPGDPPPPATASVTLSVLGDVDGDGIADLALGTTFGGSSDAGAVRVVSGATGAHLFGLHGQVGDGLGASIAPLGDLTGDGRSDFAVGAVSFKLGRAYTGMTFAAAAGGGYTLAPALASAASAPAPAPIHAGFVQVHSGADGALLCRIDGKVVGESFGEVVSSVGDVDGDGLQDLAIEAPGDQGISAGKAWRGSVWILSGASLAGSR